MAGTTEMKLRTYVHLNILYRLGTRSRVNLLAQSLMQLISDEIHHFYQTAWTTELKLNTEFKLDLLYILN